MSKTFRQYDSRWGRLSYPPGTRSTMASAGCGPTACASIIVNNPKYKNITPKTTRNFMLDNNYVPGGVGTMWSGIDACMKHFGFEVKRHNDMDSFFKEMNKGSRRAVILFGAGSRGGITWTSGGHYVPATDFKKKNGYKRSTELSESFGMYRQNYCGCVFSMKEREEAIKNKERKE